MSQILDDLLEVLLDGVVREVLIGLHWTAVVAEVDGGRRCGLASTPELPPHVHGTTDVALAGTLEEQPARDIALLAKSENPLLAGVGVAAINAMLPQDYNSWIDLNAEEVLLQHGAGKSVAVIGHFPFVDRLRSRVASLRVLEQNPLPGDFPAAAAGDILPGSEVIAISGMTLINHTLPELLALCPEESLVILLGPSTPLNPLLYNYGVDILCGSVVTAIDPVLKTVGQGGNFRQVHRAGVRTVSMARTRLI